MSFLLYSSFEMSIIELNSFLDHVVQCVRGVLDLVILDVITKPSIEGGCFSVVIPVEA